MLVSNTTPCFISFVAETSPYSFLLFFFNYIDLDNICVGLAKILGAQNNPTESTFVVKHKRNDCGF